MKNFVITILDNPKSIKVADRCIKSGKNFGIEIEKFKAITPDDDPFLMAKKLNIPTYYFTEVYSRTENCLSAFFSHYNLWKYSYENNEEIRIFEHDAVVKSSIPEFIPYTHLINLGRPSYGKFMEGTTIGVNPLFSKSYLPGAHAYQLKPYAAKELIDQAKLLAGPTDVYIHLERFPWIQELYPWPVVAEDSFTTIQTHVGCMAKHNYGETYEIV